MHTFLVGLITLHAARGLSIQLQSHLLGRRPQL